MPIRPARTDEARRLSALALRSKAHWGYSAEFMAACREELALDAAYVAGNATFVVEVDGEVVGFYALERLSPQRVELGFLFVEPECIGAGHGRALMQHAVEQARGRGHVVLEIQGDRHAERFYIAAGAARVGSRPSASVPDRALPLFELALR